MITPITFDAGGTPLFTMLDASGLAPLELPEALMNLARPAGSEQAQTAPSPEAIARFQAAMGEPSVQPAASMATTIAPDVQQPVPEAPAAIAQAPAQAKSENPAADIQRPVPATPSVTAQAPAPAMSDDPVAHIKQTVPSSPVSQGQTFEATTVQTTTIQAPAVPTPATAQVPATVQAPTAEQTPATAQVPATEHTPDTAQLPTQTTQNPASEVQHPAQPRTQLQEPAVVSADIRRPPASAEQEADIPVLHAAPVAVSAALQDAMPTAVSSPIAIEIDPAAATARTHELVEAASQVADTILVTPSLVHGEGQITIQLKPTVLDGSEIRLEAKGSAITVAIAPATPSAEQAIVQSKIQFEQTLSERMPSFQIAVSVESLKDEKRKSARI